MHPFGCFTFNISCIVLLSTFPFSELNIIIVIVNVEVYLRVLECRNYNPHMVIHSILLSALTPKIRTWNLVLRHQTQACQ